MSSATVEIENTPASSRMPWQSATVVATRIETPTVTTLVLDVPGWPDHVAGQHVDIRLTAPDGYQAQRSYSIASAPDGSSKVEVTVQNVDAGEVSPFLTAVLAVGDVLELRGPAGDYFTWEPGSNEPLFLVAGGSGIVPLMAILRTRAKASDSEAAVLLYLHETTKASSFEKNWNAWQRKTTASHWCRRLLASGLLDGTTSTVESIEQCSKERDRQRSIPEQLSSAAQLPWLRWSQRNW